VGSGADSLPKTNSVHYKGVSASEVMTLWRYTNMLIIIIIRKPLVAIVFNVLSTMFYVFEEINWRWCRHNTLPLLHIRRTMNDGVSPSPKGEGRSRLGPL